jgi:integrase
VAEVGRAHEALEAGDAREGHHVNGGRRWASVEPDVEQERANTQDAALYTVAGFTGLRQGELRALRWKHVRFADRTIVIVAGMSAGEESSTNHAASIQRVLAIPHKRI